MFLIRFFIFTLLISFLMIPAVFADSGSVTAPSPIQQNEWPEVVREAFSIQRMTAYAPNSKSIQLDYPPGTSYVIPICAVSYYETYEEDYMGWGCSWRNNGSSYTFTLTATGSNRGYVEAFAVLLSGNYFEEVSSSEFQLQGSSTDSFGYPNEDGILPIATVYAYDPGNDKDYQFTYEVDTHIIRGATGETTSSTIFNYKGQNSDSGRVYGRMVSVRRTNSNVSFYWETFSVNSMTYRYYPGGSINPSPYTVDSTRDTLVFCSIIAYNADGDDDFGAGCYDSWSGNGVSIYATGQHSDHSWAGFEGVIIQTPR